MDKNNRAVEQFKDELHKLFDAAEKVSAIMEEIEELFGLRFIAANAYTNSYRFLAENGIDFLAAAFETSMKTEKTAGFDGSGAWISEIGIPHYAKKIEISQVDYKPERADIYREKAEIKLPEVKVV